MLDADPVRVAAPQKCARRALDQRYPVVSEHALDSLGGIALAAQAGEGGLTAGGAGGHGQAAWAPRITRPSLATTPTDPRSAGIPARNSRRSPESRMTQTLGAHRRASTERRSTSCLCRREPADGSAT